jgi:hypothetical protein
MLVNWQRLRHARTKARDHTSGHSRARADFVNSTRASRRERRAWQRIPLAVPVFVRGTDESGTNFLEFTAALNVSAGGMLVSLRHHLPRRSQVCLEIPATSAPPPARSTAAVRNLFARLVRVGDTPGGQVYAFRFRRPLAAG